MTEIRLVNACIATMVPGREPYGLVEGGLVIRDGKVVESGPEVTKGEDMGGRLITPGLVDCHTHIVFGGNRAREFEMRLKGASYEELARAGGGIISTVEATRTASEDDLIAQALPRLDAAIAEGVTTIEIKSGYGLTIDDELKMLRAARRLEAMRPIKVITTFLGAHAVPPEMEADNYIDKVCIPALEAATAEGLADHADAFCEGIAFNAAQVDRVFTRAQALGLPLKIHAEQLSNLGGAVLAAGHSALSCDHLEYLDQAGVDAMAASGSVAVLLPGAFYTIHETQLPPVQALRDAGVPIAIATDCNPGSSPMSSLVLAMNMGCTLFSLTPEEVLTGATRVAAKALGINGGVIAAGARADLAIWDVAHPAELAYRIGFNPLHRRIFDGAWT
ncbi:MAG: imidazolonepropionase [Pseudomonadota bacterium]